MIEQDIKHLKYRFGSERIFRKKEDVDALNNIITFFNELGQNTLKRNNLFIKLFINEFLRQTTLSGKTSKEALKEINRLLEIPTEEYYSKMKSEIPYLRFEAVSKDIGIIPLYSFKDGSIVFNSSEEREAKNKELITKHEKVLSRAVTTEYSDKELKSFLDQHLFKTIIKYSTYD